MRKATVSAGCATRLVLGLTLIAASLCATPAEAAGQALPTAIGIVGGLVAGAQMTTGLYVLKTRATGWVMHSVEHLLDPTPEAIPLLAGPIAGGIIGYRSTSALTGAGIWGGVGLASGAAVGGLLGHLAWGDSEGRWAGGVMGSAAGLLLGVVLGAAKRGSGSMDPTTSSDKGVDIGFSLPWGGGN